MIFLRGWKPSRSFQLRAVIHHATLNNMDWNSLGTFFTFGVKHVLEGWDHLLFATALVLALRGFWEVFKVIGVFTLAHSITVSLTVVRGAPLLPEWFVEPCIAASIIFVALENIFLPGSAGSVRRLAPPSRPIPRPSPRRCATELHRLRRRGNGPRRLKCQEPAWRTPTRSLSMRDVSSPFAATCAARAQHDSRIPPYPPTAPLRL